MVLTRPPSSSVNGLRLAAFIAASVAAHGLMLSGVEPTVPSHPATASVAVTLLAPAPQEQDTDQVRERTPPPPAATAPAAPVESAPPAMRQATPRSTPPEDHAEPADAQPLARASSPADPIPARTPPPTLAAAQKPAFSLAQAREQIRARLHNDLGRHFRYPYLAQRRGWEGTVLLDLLIDTDGRISRISVAQSSGYRLLDDSAVATLNKVGNISEAARWLQGRSVELQLPVIYRLM